MTACWNLVQLTKCSTVEHAAGRLVHHMTQEQIPGQPAHRKVHSSPVPGSHCCSLDVVDVQPVSSLPEVAARWGATAYESLLELQTGRTHQVGFGQTRLVTQRLTSVLPANNKLAFHRLVFCLAAHVLLDLPESVSNDQRFCLEGFWCPDWTPSVLSMV